MQKYPKIAHKTSKHVGKIFVNFEPEHDIVIQEKLDGSNFRISIKREYDVKDKLFPTKFIINFGSRERDSDDRAFSEKAFANVIDYLTKGLHENVRPKDFENMFQMLSEHYKEPIHEMMVFGEYIGKPRQGKIPYDRTPKNYLAVFDIMVSNKDHHSFIHPCDARFDAVCKTLDFEQVPTLYFGKSGCGMQDFIKIAETFFEIDSFLGKSKIEGTVAKNYENFISEDGVNMVSQSYDGKLGLPMIKFVQERLKEHKHVEKANKDTIEGLTHYFAERCITEGRVYKAVTKLEELHNTEINIDFTGSVIRETNLDIFAEEHEEIVELLLNIFRKRFSRHARTIAQTYHKILEKRLLGEK